MKKVYFISGLGADERAFSKLELPGVTPHHIAWKIPFHHETLEAYATRMREEITEPYPTLVGLSFGGIVSIEIAKQIPCKKIILISSIKNTREKPFIFKLSAAAGLHKLLPTASFSKPNQLLHYFFGVQKHPRVKEMVNSLLTNLNPDYLNWSIDKIVNWQNEHVPAPAIHIHGTADKIFPFEKVKADYTIKNGSHFMVWTKAAEVSAILQKEL
ncbi:MAG: alpha/beta hydrolase [Bacteroidia bacterium]|nr:alpha/beta hydrolase [Bacteroidia bacterium]